MTQASLPVLFVSDLVVLPGHGRADRARRGRAGRGRRRPGQRRRASCSSRRGSRTATRRTAWSRPSSASAGSRAAGRPRCCRAGRRARIGSGVTGPGAALWVEVEPVERDRHRPRPRARRGVQAAGRRRAPAPRGLAGHRHGQPDDRPERDRRRRRLRAVPLRRAEARAARDAGRRGAARDADRLDPRPPRRGRGHRQDRRGRPRGHGEDASGSSCCASSSPRSARSSARASPRAPTTTAPGSRPPTLPEAVREAALREVDKLERSSEQNPEAAWIRTWLDTVLELPWGTRTDDSTDVVAAREVLDADHHGLDEVKERIVEYLAVRDPPRRARPAGHRRPWLRRRGPARRPSRRRQDLAR